MSRLAVTNAPRVRAVPVVIVRDSKLNGHTQEIVLRVPVKKPTPSGHPCADARGIGVFTLCGRDLHRNFFPRIPPITGHVTVLGA